MKTFVPLETLTASDFNNALAGAVIESQIAMAVELAKSTGAGTVGFNPAGNIAATNVQLAIQELDTEKTAVDDLAANSGSSLVGFIQSGTGAIVRTAQDKLREVVSVLDFGAVADGADTGAAFTGTDNTAAFQAALNYCGTNRKVMFVPAGKYRFAALTVNDTSALLLNYNYHVIESDGAELLIDDDVPNTYSIIDFIRTPNLGTSTNLDDRELLAIRSVTFRGRWTHSNTYAGCNVLTVQNFARVELDNVKAYDLRGKFSRSAYCGEVVVDNFHGERFASDGLRFIDCPKVNIVSPTLIDIDDNCIALPSTAANADVRQQLNITNVNAFRCVGILVLGAKNASITNVNMRMCSANQIYIGGASGTEGDTTPFNIVLDNITIVDPLGRPSGGSNGVPPTAITTGTDAAIVISGIESTSATTGALPGYYDAVAGAFVVPYSLDNNLKPIFYNSTKASNTVAEGHNFSLTNFSITRTLPNVAAYSAWGFGTAFSRYGRYDPAITDSSFVTNGVELIGQLSDVTLGVGTIFGFPEGSAIYLRSVASTADRRNMEFRGIAISDIVATHVKNGVSHSALAAGTSFTWEISISDCVFDCDPYHVAAARTSPLDGSWNSGAASAGRWYGILFTKASGFKIDNCTFSNCYQPVLSSATPEINAAISRNVLKCQPAALGYSASNKGIGILPAASQSFRYVIVDSTPASATYGTVLNHCVDYAASVPTSGTYVTGHFVSNTTPTTASSKTTLGWVRQSVGSGHTVATTTTADWAPLVVPTA